MAQNANGLSSFLLSKNGEIIRAALAEFLGTAILVLFSCGACVKTDGRGDALVATALTFGLTVLCLAASIGHISGCHINPGVTVGLLANGKIDIIRAAVYIIAQMVGAVAGASLLAAILPTGADKLCPTALHVSPLQGIIVEGFIVFLLVFVICNVCESNPTLAPVTIGLAVTVGHIFAIPLTSSSMNTARSFGPALIQGYWDDHYVYWVGPLVGGALAGLAHRFIFMNKALIVEKPPSKGEKNDETTNV